LNFMTKKKFLSRSCQAVPNLFCITKSERAKTWLFRPLRDQTWVCLFFFLLLFLLPLTTSKILLKKKGLFVILNSDSQSASQLDCIERSFSWEV
jgi:hypothetical protein